MPNPARLVASDQTVGRLSEVLIELPIQPEDRRLPSFREPDGVRRRLSHLQAIDRGDEVRGHEAYYEIVATYHGHLDQLEERAHPILASYGLRW